MIRLHYTERFWRSYQRAPAHIRRAFDRKAAFPTKNLRHPSLQAKKYGEAHDVWQARVNGGWRFYFQIVEDTYHIIDLTPHPK